MTALGVFSVVLAAPAVVSTLYFWIAENRLRHSMRDAPPAVDDASLPPATFFRPIKAGVPDLPAKLVTLANAMRAGDQLLIGVDAGSAEQSSAVKLQEARPELAITVVPCRPGVALNPKIAKLIQMEPFARHEHWILSDSEAVLDEEFLAGFRREWTTCDVLTTGYRFSHLANWPRRLDASATLLTLWPGLAILRASGRVRLTLGACSGFRRADVEAVGGWRAFSEELAEDNVLGKKLAALGRNVRLSARVVTLESDDLTWRDYWRHQRRIAVTYRVSNPAGFAGALLTQGVTTSLLLALLRPMAWEAWALFAAVFLSRYLTARRTAQTLAFPIPRLGPVILLASLVETMCWALSWGTRFVWWGGTRWRISREGKLQRPPQG